MDNKISLPVGKLTNEQLAYIIKSPNPCPELLIGPSIGEDCAILDFGSNLIAVTTDPITGSDKEIGKLGIHISLNDLASSGAEPVAVLVTLLCPPGTTLETIQTIMLTIHQTTKEMNIALAGGHTEITDAVTRIIINVTALGKISNINSNNLQYSNNLKLTRSITTSNAKPGDFFIMTKAAGLEGTAIIANDKYHELLQNFSKSFLLTAKGFINELSVVKEGLVAAKNGVHAMHDITEGGVLGAVWEMCTASGVGAIIEEQSIPIRYETDQICKHYHLNPLRLISSGSMLMACSNGEEMVEVLKNAGVIATIIGKVEPNGKNEITMKTLNKSTIVVDPPGSDELFKLV